MGKGGEERGVGGGGWSENGPYVGTLHPQLSRGILVDPVVKIAEGFTGCFGVFYRGGGGRGNVEGGGGYRFLSSSR